MTVSYQYDVASSASGGFIRLLFRWRGSVWKVVYRDMLIFLVAYVLLTLLYKFVLTESQQKIFETIVFFCSTFMDLIPLSFMLGFYVSFIAARWWSQFIAIPWPDKLMNIVAMYIPGLDEASRVVRRTLMRYLNLSLVLVLRSISMAVKRRFPTKDHLVEAGFMTKTELEMFQSVPSTEFNTFWIPCTWFINVLREARQECRITDSNGLKLIMEELNEFRSKCGLLWGYDWISIPLVYTQVVTMATYAFFVACMFGRQNVNVGVDSQLQGHRYDYYIPVFTILQLMFYMGLLKVAEQLINPFGDDDEDFELNWIIDRHMKVSYLGVDTLNGTPPPLVKDTYYDELDVKIPYTEASRSYKKKTYRGSVAYMQVPMEQQGMVLPDVSEESDDDGETISESMGPRRGSVYTLFQKEMRGSSPSGSFVNLDNASLDSEWKGSVLNVDQDAKNASGTLGSTPVLSVVVDMPKAEDDEIVLQEVVVEPKEPNQKTASQSSLHLPSASSCPQEKKTSSLMSILREVSPKIAPKFPREKLKSMFRKRKMSVNVPHMLKGVRFTKDTKDDDVDTSDGEDTSLISTLPDEELEIEITISNPELTEAEKLMGVHPYRAQQKAASPEALTKALKTLSAKQASEKLGGSCHVLSDDVTAPAAELQRCSSLPNISDETASAAVAQITAVPPLHKLSGTKKGKGRKPKKKKRKSPPPPSPGTDQKTFFGGNEQPVPDTSESTRRNTLPQITLTRYGRGAPEHLDLATSVSSSGPSSTSGHSSESVQVPPPPLPKRVPLPKPPVKTSARSGTAATSKLPSGTPEAGTSSASKSYQKPAQVAPKVHSAAPPKYPPPLPAPPPKPTVPHRTHSLPSVPKPFVQLRTPSPSKSKTSDHPPKLPEKPKRGLTQPLKTQKVPPTALGSASVPTSPVRSFPGLGRTPSFPETSKRPRSSSSPQRHDKSEAKQQKPSSATTQAAATGSGESSSNYNTQEDSSPRQSDQNNQSKALQQPSLPPQMSKKGSKSKK